MIKENLAAYSQGNSSPNANLTKFTGILGPDNVAGHISPNLTSATFPDDFFLGWVSPQNAPLIAGVSEVEYKNKTLTIRQIESANIDVGYAISAAAGTSGIHGHDYYYSSGGTWRRASTSGGNTVNMPLSYAIYKQAQNPTQITINVRRIVGRVMNNQTPPANGGFHNFTDAGYFYFTVSLSDLVNPTDDAVITWKPTDASGNVSVSLKDLVSGFHIGPTMSGADLRPASSTVSYITPHYIVTSFTIGSYAPWADPNDPAQSAGTAYSLVPMFRTNFTTSIFGDESSSVVPIGFGWNFVNNADAQAVQMSKASGTPVVSNSSSNYAPPYSTSPGIGEAILSTNTKKTVIYGGFSGTFSHDELDKIDVVEGDTCVVVNNNPDSDSGSYYISPKYSLSRILHDLGFCARVAMTNFSELTEQQKIEVDNFYYPQVLSSGEFTGQLIKTTEDKKTIDLQPWQYADDVADSNTYNSSKDKPSHGGGGGTGGTGDEKDRGHLATTTHTGSFLPGIQYYVLTAGQVESFVKFVNLEYNPDPEEEGELKDGLRADFKGLNPFDYVSNLIFFPWDVPNFPASHSIRLGPVDTKVGARKYISTYGATQNKILYRSNLIERYYNDFRDYPPYTTMKLDVPFCGTIEIDPKWWYGHTMTIELEVDYITGACTAFLYRDSLLTEMIAGSCGYTVPILLTDVGGFQNTIAQTRMALKSNTITSAARTASDIGQAVVSGSTGNGALAASAVGDIITTFTNWSLTADNLNYQITHSLPNAGAIGGASPLNDAAGDWCPQLIITHCKSMKFDTTAYSNLTGNACYKTGRIGDFKGYTVFGRVDLVAGATSVEKEAINAALINGVILPQG